MIETKSAASNLLQRVVWILEKAGIELERSYAWLLAQSVARKTLRVGG